MREHTREQYEERILRVQMFIQRRLDESLALDDLADVACFSPYHFHRIFRGMVGESVKEYVRRLRLERAVQELRWTKRRVTDIALEAGYETHESFTRAFRSTYGVSPSACRKGPHDGSGPFDDGRGRRYVTVLTRPGGQKMDATIQNFDAMTVASVRHVGPYAECGKAWEKLCSSEQVQAACQPDVLCIGICYDDPDVTDADKIRSDACMTVREDFTPGDGVEKQEIPGGDHAVLIHTGPYDGLHDCYRWLFGEWLPGSGREPQAAPSMEIYRNSPETTPPEELVTEIRVPLK